MDKIQQNQEARTKVAIVGSGNVGSTFAYALMIDQTAREIAIIDRNSEKAAGECMDLNHGINFAGPVKIYSGGYEACKDADIVVITAGARQESGETRLALVERNIDIFKTIIPAVTEHIDENAVIVVVSNPVDVLTYAAMKISGLPPGKVFGSGTVLDSSRFRYLISENCNIDPRNVHAYIIGEHGDSELPVWSNANIGGMQLHDYCPICDANCDYADKLGKIFSQVKESAYSIIKAKGSTYYAIGLALVAISRAVLRDQNSILPVSTLVTDYYGINDVCLGIPSLLNRTGVEKFLRIGLSSEEQEQLVKSASVIRDTIRSCGL